MKKSHIHASRLLVCAGLLGIATSAMAQRYGPQDEGRRFNDGTRVVCKNVEVRKNSKDSNRILGTATGAVVGGLLGNQIGGGNGKKLATVGGAHRRRCGGSHDPGQPPDRSRRSRRGEAVRPPLILSAS